MLKGNGGDLVKRFLEWCRIGGGRNPRCRCEDMIVLDVAGEWQRGCTTRLQLDKGSTRIIRYK